MVLQDVALVANAHHNVQRIVHVMVLLHPEVRHEGDKMTMLGSGCIIGMQTHNLFSTLHEWVASCMISGGGPEDTCLSTSWDSWESKTWDQRCVAWHQLRGSRGFAWTRHRAHSSLAEAQQGSMRTSATPFSTVQQQHQQSTGFYRPGSSCPTLRPHLLQL